MNKDELIGKQQLEIEELKDKVDEFAARLDKIHSALYCIGGPLNDNILNFNNEQRIYLIKRIGAYL